MSAAPLPVKVGFAACLVYGAVALGDAMEAWMRGGLSGGAPVWNILWATVVFGAGWGLLNGLGVARIFVAAIAFMNVLGFAAFVLAFVGNTAIESGGMSSRARDLAAMTASITIAILSTYCCLGLFTPDSETWFDKKRPRDRESTQMRFSVATLLIATAVISLSLASVPWTDLSFEPRTTDSYAQALGPNSIASYTIGVREHRERPELNQVDYLVIEVSTQGELQSRLTSYTRGVGADSTATLTLPSGEEVPLPGEHRLFELRDGELQSSAARVTWPQLRGYLDSNPESPSIEGLLAFEQPAEEE